jgi:hypothetical protein
MWWFVVGSVHGSACRQVLIVFSLSLHDLVDIGDIFSDICINNGLDGVLEVEELGAALLEIGLGLREFLLKRYANLLAQPLLHPKYVFLHQPQLPVREVQLVHNLLSPRKNLRPNDFVQLSARVRQFHLQV